MAPMKAHSRKEEGGNGTATSLVSQRPETDYLATSSCKGVWRAYLIGHIFAPSENGILVGKKKGRVDIVWRLTLSATVVWAPEGCPSEKELVAPLAKQGFVWVAPRDDFALKILVIIRFRLSSFLKFYYCVCECQEQIT